MIPEQPKQPQTWKDFLQKPLVNRGCFAALIAISLLVGGVSHVVGNARPLVMWLGIVLFPPLAILILSFQLNHKVSLFVLRIAMVFILPLHGIWDSVVMSQKHTMEYFRPPVTSSKTKSSKTTSTDAKVEPPNSDTPDFTTLKAASIQAEASLLQGLVALFATIVTGLTIVYSAYTFMKQHSHAEKQRKETYNKDLLKEFHEDIDVENGKMILEALSHSSSYLPTLHLTMYYGKQALSMLPSASYTDDINTLNLKQKAILKTADQHYALDKSDTSLFVEGELVEVIPNLQRIIDALTPDEAGSKLSLLNNKIQYSFDAFLEKFIVIGSLHINHLLQKNFSPEDEQSDDVELWWDSLDLPYWSRLIIWGTDDIETRPCVKHYKPTIRFNCTACKPCNSHNIVIDPSCLECAICPKHQKLDTSDCVNCIVFFDKHTFPPKDLLKNWRDGESGSLSEDLLKNWKKLIEFDEHKTPATKDKKLNARNMMRNYILEYYDEALKIALVLSLCEDIAEHWGDFEHWATHMKES